MVELVTGIKGRKMFGRFFVAPLKDMTSLSLLKNPNMFLRAILTCLLLSTGTGGNDADDGSSVSDGGGEENQNLILKKASFPDIEGDVSAATMHCKNAFRSCMNMRQS